MKLFKLGYNIFLGLIIATGFAVVIGISVALLLDKMFGDNFSWWAIVGIILLIFAFTDHTTYNILHGKEKTGEEEAREKNPFIPK